MLACGFDQICVPDLSVRWLSGSATLHTNFLMLQQRYTLVQYTLNMVP